MDDSWDLLHETMEKVNNFLGDYWFNEIEEANIGDVSDYVNSDSNNDVGHHHSQLSMLPQILSGSNHQIGEYECEITPEEGADMLAEEMEIVPQARARSNTWPRRQFSQQSVPVLPLVCEENFSDTGSGTHQSVSTSTHLPPAPVEVTATTPMPRKNSRRNPWGNCSYSDLIEQAILSSPDKRLTLNQIYDWLISSVSYFTDRQDNVASSGWKNSIRHNLSLHQRFLKIPNEDAGKSSWWTLNPETATSVVKQKQRRRATYGESRERMKKRAEAARSRGRLMKSRSSTTFPLSPYQENSMTAFRHRSNSNASSCDDSMSLFSSEDTTFRSRSYSNASSASQSSIAQLSELSATVGVGVGPCFQSIKDDISTDLEGIKMEDLSLGCDFIREYLSPPSLPTNTQYQSNNKIMESNTTQSLNSQQNVTILEPRDNEMVCQSVIVNMYQSLDKKLVKKLDEKRRLMIENELSHLIAEKVKLCNGTVLLGSENNDFDLKIKLLQEELQRLERNKTLALHPHNFNTQLAL